MENKRFFKAGSAELAESPRPLAPQRIDTDPDGHPGLRSSLVNVPVTPGIHLGEYASESSSGGSRPTTGYFQHDISKLRETMAQSPTEAASGATSNRDILRRMSLTGGRKRTHSIAEIDPRAANPTLSLSGGIISATFCIPYSLQYRKGADWVSTPICLWCIYTDHQLGIEPKTRHFSLV
jgi:trehalose 6-phosphate synthase/phosphatase